MKLLQISPKSGNALKICILFTPTNVDDPSHSYLKLLAKNHKLANKTRKHTHASNRRFAWLYTVCAQFCLTYVLIQASKYHTNLMLNGKKNASKSFSPYICYIRKSLVESGKESIEDILMTEVTEQISRQTIGTLIDMENPESSQTAK